MKKSLKKICLVLCFLTFSTCFFGFTNVKYEKSLTIIAKDKKYTFTYPQIYFNGSEYILLRQEQIIERIYLDTFVDYHNATLNFNSKGSERFVISNEKIGCELDRVKLKYQINKALATGERVVKCCFIDLLPNLTKKDLQKQTYLRGQFSTYYSTSSQQRKNNISIAVSSIDGYIVNDNDTFSFNKVVGERSLERGYQIANVFQDGKLSQGVGGGVCQVSSTLYNTALISGLDITESHQHSQTVGYVQPSFDAMVSDNLFDLKFVNGTGSDIYITASADGKEIRMQIYGLKRRYEYKTVSQITKTILAKYIAKNNELLKSGESVIVSKAKNGIQSTGYLYIYEGARRIAIKKLRSDSYNAVDGVMEVGVGWYKKT